MARELRHAGSMKCTMDIEGVVYKKANYLNNFFFVLYNVKIIFWTCWVK